MKAKATRLPPALLALVLVGAAGCTVPEPGANTGSGPGAGSGVGGNGAGVGGSSSGGSSSGGTGASGGSAGTGPQPREMSLEGAPIYTRFMRLTNEQWENSVTDILGLTAPPGLAQSFERPVAGTTDFINNEHLLTVSNGLWASYQLASEAVATQATGTPEALSRLYTGTDAAGFIQSFGRRSYRRPLTPAEAQSYQAIFDLGAATSGPDSAFAKGAALVIRTMLQSPHFLYRSELGDTGAPLSGYEIASKLSFWLRNRAPNDTLLDAAAAGQLATPAGITAQAAQMLEEPGALAVMRDFHRQLLTLDRYQNIIKIDVPSFTDALKAEYEESSYLFFDRIFSQGLGVREILTSTMGFVGPQSAPLYGLPAPASGFEERDLGASRPGYFTQLPYLTLHALDEEPDSIHRGVTINLGFLCADPGAAVPNLPPVPELKPDQTNRERITSLTGICGGECHNHYINPIGFAFENFDGMGRFRDTDNGKPVDTAGQYPFAEGVIPFTGAADLMGLMANGKQAHACYSKKISSYALQRDIVATDLPLLDVLAAVSMDAAGSVKQVMLELVSDPAFTVRAEGTP